MVRIDATAGRVVVGGKRDLETTSFEALRNAGTTLADAEAIAEASATPARLPPCVVVESSLSSCFGPSDKLFAPCRPRARGVSLDYAQSLSIP